MRARASSAIASKIDIRIHSAIIGHCGTVGPRDGPKQGSTGAKVGAEACNYQWHCNPFLSSVSTNISVDNGDRQELEAARLLHKQTPVSSKSKWCRLQIVQVSHRYPEGTSSIEVLGSLGYSTSQSLHITALI